MECSKPDANLFRCNKAVNKFAVFISCIALLSIANIVFSNNAFAQSQAIVMSPKDGTTLDPTNLTILISPNDASAIKITLGSSPGTADLYNGEVFEVDNTQVYREYIMSNISTDGDYVYLTFSQQVQTEQWINTEFKYSVLKIDGPLLPPPEPPEPPTELPPEPTEQPKPPKPPEQPEPPKPPEQPEPPK